MDNSHSHSYGDDDKLPDGYMTSPDNGESAALRGSDSGIMNVRGDNWGATSWNSNELQGHYIRAIRSYRLLTPEEELDYARQFSEGRAVMRSMIERFPQVIVAQLEKLVSMADSIRFNNFLEVEYDSGAAIGETSEEHQVLAAIDELLKHRTDVLAELEKHRLEKESGVKGGGGEGTHVRELGEHLKKIVPGVVKLRFQQHFYASCVDLFITGQWNAPGLSVKEHDDLCARMQTASNSSIEAMNRMVEANLRLVISIARRYVCSLMSLADLVQEGNIGLMRAVEAFEYQRGHRFSTYASYWIRQAISSALNANGRSIRMPVNILRQLSHIRNFERMFLQEHGVLPSLEQIAQETELTVARVRALQRMSQQPISLQSIVNEDHETSELLADEHNSRQGVGGSIGALRSSLEHAMDLLDEREKEIIVRRFGLNGCEEETLEQIARRFALTSERIRQLESIALRKLRKPESQQYLEDWR